MSRTIQIMAVAIFATILAAGLFTTHQASAKTMDPNPVPLVQTTPDENYGYNGGNEVEQEWCAPWHRRMICARALILAKHATKTTIRNFGQNGANDASDAFRHCYWSGIMTQKFGAETAKGFGDRHEGITPATQSSQKSPETIMDLHNNEVGRYFGSGVDNLHDVATLCYHATEKVVYGKKLQTSLTP